MLENQNRTVINIFLNKLTDKHNENIYSQAKILFDLGEKKFKNLFNKRIIKSDSDQLNIEKYEESIAERTKFRKQRLSNIKRKEQNINNKLFKNYFNYQSPSKMHNTLSDTKNTKEHNIQVNVIKSGLTDFKKDIGNKSKNDANKIKEINEVADIVELILHYNNDDQQRQGLKILKPNQMLSRLSITFAQLKAGNNSEKFKNEIRQLLYS